MNTQRVRESILFLKPDRFDLTIISFKDLNSYVKKYYAHIFPKGLVFELNCSLDYWQALVITSDGELQLHVGEYVRKKNSCGVYEKNSSIVYLIHNDEPYMINFTQHGKYHTSNTYFDSGFNPNMKQPAYSNEEYINNVATFCEYEVEKPQARIIKELPLQNIIDFLFLFSKWEKIKEGIQEEYAILNEKYAELFGLKYSEDCE
jgi:hypothetical protein